METILHLLSVRYLFARNLGPFTSDLAYIFLGINIFLIVTAIIISKLAKKRDLLAQKVAARYRNFAWTMGLIGIILYTFREINVLYLSAPIIILLWLIIAIIWFGFVLKYKLFVVPKRRSTIQSQESKQEYL
jgi:hypothetical protein